MVSVIVVAYNRRDLTERCWQALQTNADCDYEFILVDNGSTDDTQKWAAQHDLPCLRLDENVGAAQARNQGALRATGDELAFFDNDAFCLSAGLSRLVDAAQGWGISAQTGSNFTPEGGYQGDTDLWYHADGAGGYCLTFRRDVWEITGGFDLSFPRSGCEDMDFCLRARLRGYDFRFVPAAVEHLGHGTVGTHWTPDEEQAWIAESQALLRERYHDSGLGMRVLLMGRTEQRQVTGLRTLYPLCRIHAVGDDLPGLQGIDHWFTGDTSVNQDDYSCVWRR